MPLTLAIIKDDDPKNLVRCAREAGFAEKDMHVAQDQRSALDLIRTLIPDIAIVDPHLTENERLEDGIDVIRTLRNMRRQCIIICLTSCGTPALGARALSAGANDHIDMSWPSINWYELLREKLVLWQGVVMRKNTQ